jgi:hypothetical protein
MISDCFFIKDNLQINDVSLYERFLLEVFFHSTRLGEVYHNCSQNSWSKLPWLHSLHYNVYIIVYFLWEDMICLKAGLCFIFQHSTCFRDCILKPILWLEEDEIKYLLGKCPTKSRTVNQLQNPCETGEELGILWNISVNVLMLVTWIRRSCISQ